MWVDNPLSHKYIVWKLYSESRLIWPKLVEPDQLYDERV